jgi:hypothetical protein
MFKSVGRAVRSVKPVREAMSGRILLLALYFGDFRRRKPAIHCADDAVHLLRIPAPTIAPVTAGWRNLQAMAVSTWRTAMPRAHGPQPFD